MNLAFEKREVACLQPSVFQVQSVEQTQELRLPENRSGQARILGAWGQPVLRGKQWQSDRFQITGGILAWVLWEPEDGGKVQSLDTWIPFKIEWDLEPECPEGVASVQLLLKNLDVREVSAGKLMIRSGVAAMVRCWHPHTASVYMAAEVPEDVALLRQQYPMRLPREMGEKPFTVEEQLTLPPSAPTVDKLLYARMDPVVTDRKVLGNKIVFRGNGNLHILYLDEESGVRNWDFELPFSQYAELSGSYSPDAQADVMITMTNLETAADGEGVLNLRAGMTGQYLVVDREMIETVADAFSPLRTMEVQYQPLTLPGILDDCRETVGGEKQIPLQADGVVDAVLLHEFPRQRRDGDGITVEVSGTVQILHYDPEGKLQSGHYRWEGNGSVKADTDTVLHLQPMTVQSRIMPGTESMVFRTEMPVQVTAMSAEGLPMVAGIAVGEKQEPDPARPSLILRRAGKESLWTMARSSGSTVEMIRAANGLEGEPEPGQMLLIPVV